MPEGILLHERAYDRADCSRDKASSFQPHFPTLLAVGFDLENSLTPSAQWNHSIPPNHCPAAQHCEIPTTGLRLTTVLSQMIVPDTGT